MERNRFFYELEICSFFIHSNKELGTETPAKVAERRKFAKQRAVERGILSSESVNDEFMVDVILYLADQETNIRRGLIVDVDLATIMYNGSRAWDAYERARVEALAPSEAAVHGG